IVAVLVANVAFFAIVGATPGMGASAQDISDFLARSSTRVYAGGYVEIVAFPLILVFFGRLREILRRAEGAGGWLANTAYGAAIAVASPATLWSPNDVAQIPPMLLYLWVLAVSLVLIRHRELAYLGQGRPAEA